MNAIRIKAGALAKPTAALGGSENALRFPAHRNQSTIGLSPQSNQRPVPARRARSARRGRGGRWPVALGHRLGIGMGRNVAKAGALAKSSVEFGHMTNP